MTTSLILDYSHNGKADGIINTNMNNNNYTYTASSTLTDTIPTADYLYYLDQVKEVENPSIPIVKTKATTSPPKLVVPTVPPRRPVLPIIKLIKNI